MQHKNNQLIIQSPRIFTSGGQVRQTKDKKKERKKTTTERKKERKKVISK
jgi:hypothetical protein